MVPPPPPTFHHDNEYLIPGWVTAEDEDAAPWDSLAYEGPTVACLWAEMATLDPAGFGAVDAHKARRDFAWPVPAEGEVADPRRTALGQKAVTADAWGAEDGRAYMGRFYIKQLALRFAQDFAGGAFSADDRAEWAALIEELDGTFLEGTKVFKQNEGTAWAHWGFQSLYGGAGRIVRETQAVAGDVCTAQSTLAHFTEARDELKSWLLFSFCGQHGPV